MILQFILALIGFVFSPIGMFAIGIGTVLFLTLPIIPKVTGQFKKFAHFHLWLAMWTVQRAAFVVSEHDEVLFKRMTFDDIGVEKIDFNNTTKEFEDPYGGALHYWKGVPFALADEVHGILFDPRHAAIGSRKQEHEENGEMVVKASSTERSMYEVFGWVRGVFEFPTDTHELVSLSAVRNLVTGSERAEHGERVEEFYQFSRDPYKDGVSGMRIAMIVVALCAPFGMMWFLASQFGGGAGGGSGGTTIGYGMLFTFATIASWRELLSDVDWKAWGIRLAVLAPLPLAFLAIAVLVSPILAILFFLLLGAGFWFFPFLAFIGRALTPLGGLLSRSVFLKLGLLGFDRPVFEWTPRKYEVKEFDELNDPDDVTWYGIAGSLVGFTFQPGPGSFENGVYDKDHIANRLEADVTVDGEVVQSDGGTKTNLPVEYRRYPEMKRAVYGGFVPKKSRLSRGACYLDTGIWFQKFTNAATGEKALNKLLEAKQKHGGLQAMDDSRFMWLVFGAGIFSFIMGILMFFVLPVVM